jgi:transcriptional regulator with XRE-family HTH domain
LGEIERGEKRPSFQMIMKMAEVYRVPAGEFFRYLEPMGADGYVRLIVETLARRPVEEVRRFYRVLLALTHR